MTTKKEKDCYKEKEEIVIIMIIVIIVISCHTKKYN